MTNDIYSVIIDILCKELKAAGLRRSFTSLAREDETNNYSIFQFLSACPEEEKKHPDFRIGYKHIHNKLSSLLRKQFRNLIYAVIPSLPKTRILSLAEGNFIREKENVICM